MLSRRTWFHLYQRLTSWRYWVLLGGFVLVFGMMAWHAILHLDASMPVHALLLYGFDTDIAKIVMVVLAALSVVDVFGRDYQLNLLPMLVTRLGYRRYAQELLGLVFLSVYLFVMIAGSLILVGLGLRFSLWTHTSEIETMTNGWLAIQGNLIGFYFSYMSNLALMMSFYAMLAASLSVVYPNQMMSYLLPSVLWFGCNVFGIERVLPFFLAPNVMLGQGNNITWLFNYFHLPYGQWANLLLPYVYVFVFYLVIPSVLAFLLKYKVQLYEREGIRL